MKNVAATIISTLLLMPAAAHASSLGIVPIPPEAPSINQQTGMPEPLLKLSFGAAELLTEIHEHRYWHGWHMKMRFGKCFRARANIVHCPVEDWLAVIAGEKAHWVYSEDVVNLGHDDRAWIETVFPRSVATVTITRE